MKLSGFVLKLPFVIVLFLLTACEKAEPAVISNGIVSLQLWSDWKYKSFQGIDTIQGVFNDGNEEINFSEDFMDSVDLAGIVQTPETLYFEETIIDNRPAKIVKVKYNRGTLLFLIMNKNVGSDVIQLSVENPCDDQKYITVFKSLLFL